MDITQFITYANSNINDSQLQASEGNARIADSLRVIIEEVFMVLATSLTIVISCRGRKQFNLYMHVMQHLNRMLPDLNMQLIYVDHKNPQRIEGQHVYNMLLIDSYQSFLDIDVISYTQNLNFNEYYHIFIMQYDELVFDDMQNIFNYCWQHQIINCNIEFQNRTGDLLVYTYFPFAPNRCGNTDIHLVNHFGEHKWLKTTKFLPKVSDLHGCPLVGAIRDMPFFTKAYDVNGTVHFQGLEKDMIDEIAWVMNFTTEFREPLVDDRWLTSSGGMNMLERNEAHFAFGYYRKRTSTSNRFTTTVPHYQSAVITAINHSAHKIKSAQVLTFPFSKYTWIAMAVSFVFMTVITKCVRMRYPEAIRTFSIVASTLGIPIQETPRRLESILLFTPWLWSTLILRSMYSGLLYHLFSNDIYQRLPKSLMGAANASYHSVLTEFTFRDIQDVPFYNMSNSEQNSIVLRSTDETVPLDYLLNHREELVFAVIAQEFLMYYVKVNNKTGLFYTMPEILIQQQLCFYLRKHSFLVNEFDLAILDLKAVGLVKFLMKRHLSTTFKPSAASKSDKNIQQDDLYGLYYSCFGLYGMAILLFIFELLSKRIIVLRMLFEYFE